MLVFPQYCSNFHRSHGAAQASIDAPHLSAPHAGFCVRAPLSRHSKPAEWSGAVSLAPSRNSVLQLSVGEQT